MGIFTECLYVSCVSTFHIIYIVILGVLFHRYKLVDENFERSLAKLITNLYLPAFIFCEIVKTLDISNYYLLLQVIGGVMVVNLVGAFVSFIIYFLHGSSCNELRFICAIISSPHSTSIPLILIETLSPVLEKIPYYGSRAGSARDRGLFYVALISIFSNMWRWGVNYNLINPLLKEEKEKALLGGQLENPVEENEEEKWHQMLVKIVNMPLVVSLVSILLVSNSTVKYYFTSDDSIIKDTIFDVHKVVADGLKFSVIFLLGLNFAKLKIDHFTSNEHETDREMFSLSKLMALTFIKMVVLPFVGSPIIFYLFDIGFFTDGVLAFLFLFMFAAPIAINIIIICSLKKTRVKTISMLLFIQYATFIITLTISNTIYLYILT